MKIIHAKIINLLYRKLYKDLFTIEEMKYFRKKYEI